MADIILYKWQFKEIEPGKRVKRRLNFHMTEETARERYGDAIEPQPGSREVRNGAMVLHRIEATPKLLLEQLAKNERAAALARQKDSE